MLPVCAAIICPAVNTPAGRRRSPKSRDRILARIAVRFPRELARMTLAGVSPRSANRAQSAGSMVIRAALIRYLYVTIAKAGDKIRRITAR